MSDPLAPSSSTSSVHKLQVPRHSYTTSVTSVSSGIPAQSGNRSMNSVFRLSRANTSTMESSNQAFDGQSVRPNDRAPSAKPNVTYLDKLWTQIDVLDDVKSMLREVREKGSFFNESFALELDNLKAQQDKLLDVVTSQKFDTKSVNALRSSEDVVSPTGGGKIEEFFETTELTKYEQKRRQDFMEMNSYIEDVKNGLDEVAESMKKFGNTTRDMWWEKSQGGR